jgi:hypothetical protein
MAFLNVTPWKIGHTAQYRNFHGFFTISSITSDAYLNTKFKRNFFKTTGYENLEKTAGQGPRIVNFVQKRIKN